MDTDADSVDVEACMYFTLYNDGWQLDDIEILSTKFSPLVGPPRDMVTSYLADRYDYFQYQGEEVDLENGFAKFYYKAMDGYTYADYGYNLCVKYYYSGTYWNYGDIELMEEIQDWRRICGVWDGTDHLQSTYDSVFTIAIDAMTVNPNFMLNGSLVYNQVGVGNHVNDESQYIDKYFSFSLNSPQSVSNQGFTVDFLEEFRMSVFELDRDKGVIHRGALDYHDTMNQVEQAMDEMGYSFYNEFFKGEAEVEIGVARMEELMSNRQPW